MPNSPQSILQVIAIAIKPKVKYGSRAETMSLLHKKNHNKGSHFSEFNYHTNFQGHIQCRSCHFHNGHPRGRHG
jgi:hypothetical protein